MTDQSLYGQRGQLAYDAATDTLQCHVCGRPYHGLAQHARLSHGMDADDYRAYAGLNRSTRLITPTMSARLREVTAPTITRLRGEGKLRRWDEDPAKWQADKAAAVEAVRQGLRPEATAHRQDAYSEERRRDLSERRRQRNLEGMDKASHAALSAGATRYYAEHPEALAALKERGARQTPPAIVPRTVACQRCGETFQTTGHADKYCPACRPLVARERGRLSRRRQAGVRAVLPEPPTTE